MIREPATRNAEKFDKIEHLLTYNNLSCYVGNINANTQMFRCPSYNIFFAQKNFFH